MAINICDVCNDTCLRNIIGTANNLELWRRAVIELLCGIAAAGGGGENVVNLEQVQIPAATLQSGYTTFADPGFLDSTKKLNHLWVTNYTDADVEISLDGGDSVAFTVLANTAREFNLGNYTGAATDSFQVKRATGQTASTGILYLEGTYAA